MLRKAIHLDAREERASIDPARAAAGRRAARLNFLARSHVVSGPRLLKERDPVRPVRDALVMARLFTLLPNWQIRVRGR